MVMILCWLDKYYGCFRMILDDFEQLIDEMVYDVYKGMNVFKEMIEKVK